jgi:adenylate kinase
MKAIILLGPPGVGKGTAAESILAATDYLHVSTGDILRDAVKSGSSVGLEARSYMEKGELVPDDIILKVVKDYMGRQGREAHYLFDGFPRTTEQARLLDAVMAESGGEINHVFLMEAPREVLIRRIAGRRICRACGAVYNVYGMPPREEGVCDQCGGELYQRPDDNEDTVLNRLEVFTRQTEQLIDYYDKKDLLVRVEAGGDRAEVEQQILSTLEGAASGS